MKTVSWTLPFISTAVVVCTFLDTPQGSDFFGSDQYYHTLNIVWQSANYAHWAKFFPPIERVLHSELSAMGVLKLPSRKYQQLR